MLSCASHRNQFAERLSAARSLLDAAHPGGVSSSISRDARGLTVLLLYAAYENLLVTLCRSLLEVAIQLRIGNRRLQPGLRLIAVHARLQKISSLSSTAIWKAGFDVVDAVSHARECTISPDTFPNDGTNFRRSQVGTFCKVFNLGDPAPILREAWNRLDTIVTERNAVAHGRMTASEVGRNYSVADMQGLVDIWELRWNEFIDWVELAAATRDFFRMPQ